MAGSALRRAAAVKEKIFRNSLTYAHCAVPDRKLHDKRSRYYVPLISS
ncbi:Uncharacterized protein pbN1_17670 [Aromatoleum bremense]|nr:Uncharacterized protein pbN1_17670 [Aromatoleum bremense]